MTADVAIENVAASGGSLVHGLKWRQSFDSAAELALVVSGLHSDAAVWPGEIDSTAIVVAKKLAPLSAVEEHCHAVLGDLLHHLVHALAGMMSVGVDQPWFAEHVDLIAFDEEMAFAARAALVAFVLCHCRIVARSAVCASRRHFHFQKPRPPVDAGRHRQIEGAAF